MSDTIFHKTSPIKEIDTTNFDKVITNIDMHDDVSENNLIELRHVKRKSEQRIIEVESEEYEKVPSQVDNNINIPEPTDQPSIIINETITIPESSQELSKELTHENTNSELGNNINIPDSTNEPSIILNETIPIPEFTQESSKELTHKNTNSKLDNNITLPEPIDEIVNVEKNVEEDNVSEKIENKNDNIHSDTLGKTGHSENVSTLINDTSIHKANKYSSQIQVQNPEIETIVINSLTVKELKKYIREKYGTVGRKNKEQLQEELSELVNGNSFQIPKVISFTSDHTITQLNTIDQEIKDLQLKKQKVLRDLKINKNKNRVSNQKRKRTDIKLNNKIKKEEKKQKYLEMIVPKIEKWLLSGHGQDSIREQCEKEKIPLDNKLITQVKKNLSDEQKHLCKEQKRIKSKENKKETYKKFMIVLNESKLGLCL